MFDEFFHSKFGQMFVINALITFDIEINETDMTDIMAYVFNRYDIKAVTNKYYYYKVDDLSRYYHISLPDDFCYFLFYYCKNQILCKVDHSWADGARVVQILHDIDAYSRSRYCDRTAHQSHTPHHRSSRMQYHAHRTLQPSTQQSSSSQAATATTITTTTSTTTAPTTNSSKCNFMTIGSHTTEVLCDIKTLQQIQDKFGGRVSINTLMLTALSRVVKTPAVVASALTMSGKHSAGNGASGIFYPIVSNNDSNDSVTGNSVTNRAQTINNYVSTSKKVIGSNSQAASDLISKLYRTLGEDVITFVLATAYSLVLKLPLQIHSTTNLAFGTQPLRWGSATIQHVQIFTSLQLHCPNFSYLIFYSYLGHMYVCLNQQPVDLQLISRMRQEVLSWLQN